MIAKKLSVFSLIVVSIAAFLLKNSYAEEYEYEIIYTGVADCYSKGVNDSEIVVGFFSDGGGFDGYIYDGLDFQTVSVPNAQRTYIEAVNNEGEMTGSYEDSSGKTRGFLFDGVAFITIDAPNAQHTTIYGMNDIGDLVGVFSVNGISNAFHYDGVDFHVVNHPGARRTWLFDINNNSLMIGQFYDFQNNRFTFTYDGSEYKTAIFPSGINSAWGYGLNDLGHIVGAYDEESGDRHGFVYDGNSFIIIDVPGSKATICEDIDNKGQIAGWFGPDSPTSSPLHGFLAKPIVGWETVYDTLFDNQSDLKLLRKYRDEILSKTDKGSEYKDLLYKNSEKALAVLLKNPELLAQAKDLIYANILAVDDVINDQEGIIFNTEKIAAFLDAYAKKAPPELKALAKMVKWHMVNNQRKGKLFFGFRLE